MVTMDTQCKKPSNKIVLTASWIPIKREDTDSQEFRCKKKRVYSELYGKIRERTAKSMHRRSIQTSQLTTVITTVNIWGEENGDREEKSNV